MSRVAPYAQLIPLMMNNGIEEHARRRYYLPQLADCVGAAAADVGFCVLQAVAVGLLLMTRRGVVRGRCV